MKYRQSFSGADARAYAYFEGMEQGIVRLESLHTISYSVHEAKGMVRALGRRGIKGVTRAVRTIAGSMIFLVIDDHPLRPLINSSYDVPFEGSMGWSLDKYMQGQGSALGLEFKNRLPSLMPPFNLLINYVNELAEVSRVDPLDSQDVEQALFSSQVINFDGAATLIRGIEFIDEGVVTSVNDIVSEITYSFIARDLKPLSANTLTNILQSPPQLPSETLQEELQKILFYGPPTSAIAAQGYNPDLISEEERFAIVSEELRK